MNYRHAYHAGNFGDVLKHVVLSLCLAHLKRKETPFRVIDTHAGSGLYRLDVGEAEKTGEWRSGIARIAGPDADPLPAAVEDLLAPYFETLKALNEPNRLAVYPGSPLVAQYALRNGDALVANELHHDDNAALKRSLGKDRKCKVSNIDAYVALKASLPPKERRGLVLIDPPFEEPGELIRMTDALRDGITRFATGHYLLWYPIKDEKLTNRFCRKVADVVTERGLEPPLRVELLLRPLRNPLLLNGAGLIVVNAPYRLKENLETILPILARRLGDDKKGWHRIDVLSAVKPDRLPLEARTDGRPVRKQDD